MKAKKIITATKNIDFDVVGATLLATDTRGYACQFSCNACDCVVSETYYMRPDQFDYSYCPYCGRPVESGE